MPEILTPNPEQDFKYILNPSAESLGIIKDKINNLLPDNPEETLDIPQYDSIFRQIQFLKSQLNILGVDLANSDSSEEYARLQIQLREAEIDFFQNQELYQLVSTAQTPEAQAYFQKMIYEYGAHLPEQFRSEIKRLIMDQESLAREYEKLERRGNQIPMVIDIINNPDFSNPILRNARITEEKDLSNPERLKELVLLLQEDSNNINPSEVLKKIFVLQDSSTHEQSLTEAATPMFFQIYTAHSALANYDILKRYVEIQRQRAELISSNPPESNTIYEAELIARYRDGMEIPGLHRSLLSSLEEIKQRPIDDKRPLGYTELQELSQSEEVSKQGSENTSPSFSDALTNVASFLGFRGFQVTQIIHPPAKTNEVEETVNVENTQEFNININGQKKRLILKFVDQGKGSTTSLIGENTVLIMLDNPDLSVHEAGHALDALLQDPATPAILSWTQQSYVRHELMAFLAQVIGNRPSGELGEISQKEIDTLLNRMVIITNFAKVSPYLLQLDNLPEEYRNFARIYDQSTKDILNRNDNFDRLYPLLHYIFDGYHNAGVEYSVAIRAARNLISKIRNNYINPQQLYKLLSGGKSTEQELLELVGVEGVTTEDLGYQI